MLCASVSWTFMMAAEIEEFQEHGQSLPEKLQQLIAQRQLVFLCDYICVKGKSLALGSLEAMKH